METQQAVKANPEEIKRAIQALGKNRLTELRAYGPGGIISGYFTDTDKLATALYEVSENQTQGAVCWTIQRIDPVKVSGEASNMYFKAGKTTSDAAISDYEWFVLDFDPFRPSDLSSTGAEKEAARVVANNARAFFAQRAISTVLADSGNGFHILIRLAIPNTESAPALLKATLAAFAAKFGNPQVKIDQTLFNPSRILKAYGTVARKGPSTAERPHRLSQIIDAPASIHEHALDRAGLEKLLDDVNQQLSPELQATIALGASEYPVAGDEEVDSTVEWIKELLDLNGVRYDSQRFTKPVGQGYQTGFYVRCLWEPEHGYSGPTSTYVGSNESAQQISHCGHDTCRAGCAAAKNAGSTSIGRFKNTLKELRGKDYKEPLAEGRKPWEGFIDWGTYRTTVAWDGADVYTYTDTRADGSKTITKCSLSSGAVEVKDFAADGTPAKPQLNGLFDFKKPAITGDVYDFVLGPKQFLSEFRSQSQFPDGWFARGQVHLVAGPSGVGKSRWLYPALSAQFNREEYFGHPSFGLPYLVIALDRGGHSLTRTLNSMDLGSIRKHIQELDYCTGAEAFKKIRDLVEKCEVTPAVLLIEGLDIMVEKPNDPAPVAQFLKMLAKLAFHYHIAIIGTVGSPKMKQKDGWFTSDRDSIFGSAIWGRMTDTIVVMKFIQNKSSGEIEDAFRKMKVMPRDGAPEKFVTTFQGGRLVAPDIDMADVETDPSDPGMEWAKKQEGYWTVEQFSKALGVVRTTGWRRLQRLMEQDAVHIKPGPKEGAELYKVGPAPQTAAVS
jgi:hypothetical protein